MSDALAGLLERTQARWGPPPDLTVSAWADRYRVLTAESSAEPGRWRTDRVPYMRAVMNAIGDRHTRTIVVQASAQVSKTETLINALLYHVMLDPAPCMFLAPTLEMSSATSKDRLEPAIRAIPEIADLAGPQRSRNSGQTILHKQFANGAVVTLAGANSPASLASRPIRLVLADEVDRWPASAGDEGDPLLLVTKRQTTFRRAKTLITSTPTVSGASRIEAWYEISDKRQWHVPCPRCGESFVLAWEHVRFTDRDPSSAYLECPNCSGRIDEKERLPMVAAGRWVASAPFTGVAGFHLNQILSPWRKLSDTVSEFLVARQSLETRQVFRNTVEGLPWEAPGQKLDSSSLLARRETYASELPAAVQVLTCGVDTQDSHLHAIVIGWGLGEEAFIIHGETLEGDPASPTVWAELDELLSTPFRHEKGGSLTISSALVDGGGHKTQSVYDACIARRSKRVLGCCFGRDGGESGLLVSPQKAIKTKGGGTVLRRIVDVSQAKSLIYGRLKAIAEPGPEYVHIPSFLGQQFVDELTAEKLITSRNKFGIPTRKWQQIREANHALDCFVYALAALRAVAPNGDKFNRLASALDLERLRKSA